MPLPLVVADLADIRPAVAMLRSCRPRDGFQNGRSQPLTCVRPGIRPRKRNKNPRGGSARTATLNTLCADELRSQWPKGAFEVAAGATATLPTHRSYYAARMEDGLVDRIERAFIAAVKAHMEPIRLELTRTEHEELSRQYGVPEGLRMYRGRPVVIASEFRWVTV
jgi:hypothetical protein